MEYPKMKKAAMFLWMCVSFPMPMLGAPDTNGCYSNMLNEVMSCFSGGQSCDQLIKGWKWGNIKASFAFDFRYAMPEKRQTCWIFAACPFSSETNCVPLFEEFPSVADLRDSDRPYFFFGTIKDFVEGTRSLDFIYCEENTAFCSNVLKRLNMHEPTYEAIRTRYPDQFWDTIVHGSTNFQYSSLDDCFVKCCESSSALDVVCRFNQKVCLGVMLLRRGRSPPKPRTLKVSSDRVKLDICKFNEAFKWGADHQVEIFARKRSLALDKYKSRMDFDFDQKMTKYKMNDTVVQSLGLQLIGGVRTPSSTILDVPWLTFNYYSTGNNGVFLRSLVEERGYFYLECFDSVVVDIGKFEDAKQIQLPYGLDIRLYLQGYPSSCVLYEHLRHDGRCRIVVQPYIACLYEDNSLKKVLICGKSEGPADHGWGLVRSFYCYEKIGCYYWPVLDAYCPL